MKTQIKKSSEVDPVKFLERSYVIRLFGLALVLAPFINIGIALLVRKIEKHQTYNIPTLLKLISTGTWTHHILTLASLVIGSIMLRGSMTAWKYVLGLLGCHIGIQIFNIGHDLRENWLWGPFFLVNLSIFFFIADQLVFKIKVKPVKNIDVDKVTATAGAEPEPVAVSIVATAATLAPAVDLAKPPEVRKISDFMKSWQKIKVVREQKIKNKILIHYGTSGAWAFVTGVSTLGLHAKSLTNPPAGFESKEIEFQFPNGMLLKGQFKDKNNQDFFFEFKNLTSENQKLLNHWIRNKAA